MKYLKLMRIKHYVKNLLVFCPLLFSGELLNIQIFLHTIIGFFAFSLVSSAVYIVNDICDVEKDKLHPAKRNRPIASGDISKEKASIIAVISFTISMLLQIILSNFMSSMCILTYLILNYLYSKKLKNKPLLDIIILVSGFFIRMIYGALITNISISTWLYLTVITGAFYMALGKRRNELKLTGNETREVLGLYSYEFLDKNMYVCMALLNTFYALWAANKNANFLLTVPIVLIISMKYSFNIERCEDGDPVSILLSDKLILFLSMVYALYIFLVLYII